MFTKFLKKLELPNAVAIKASSLFDKALLEYRKRNFDEAVELFDKAKELYMDLGHDEKIARCAAEIAITYFYLSRENTSKAIRILEEASAYFEIGTKKNDTLARIILYFGIIEFAQKNYARALRLYKNAQELTSRNSLVNACILDNVAVYNLRSKNFPLAQRYLEESLRIKIKSKNNAEIAETTMLLGRYFASVEDSNNAIKFLKAAKELLKKDENYNSLARVLDEISKAYLLEKDIRKAEHYYNRAMDIAPRCQNRKIYAFLYCTYAEILTLKNKPEDALELIKKNIEPIFATPREKAILKKLMSKVYIKLGHFELALEKNHEALSLFHSIENHIDAIKCHIDLAYIYSHKDYTQMATSSLLEALELSKSYDLQVFSQKIEDLIFELDKEEWSNIVNDKVSNKKNFTDNKSLIETLNLLENITQDEDPYRDPLISLLKIGRSISAETDLEKLVKIIEKETKAALDAQSCTVFAYHSKTQELSAKILVGTELQDVKFSAKTGLAGYVARTGEGVNIKDAYNDDRFNSDIDRYRSDKTKTILCIPFKNINQQVVGVIQVINKRNNRVFTDKDEDLLMAIGSSAGIAIENAILFATQKRLFEEQKDSFKSFVDALSKSIDARDSITAGHSSRVRTLAVSISQEMKLSEDDIEVIKYAANLHDIGKIGIRDDVLLKCGRLTPEEYKHIQEHASITSEILNKISFQENLKDVPLIASSHHEKYDGSGYFRGLRGSEIPFGGRVLAVADVFDAITSKRHYRDKMPIEKALGILLEGKGTHFDPCIIDKFFEISIDKILNVIISNNDRALTDSQIEYFQKYSVGSVYNAAIKPEEQRSVIEQLLLTNFNKLYLGVEEE
jgi:HD-GYP domain-containing protein (c-di-GMP phosphodiesterase class II)